MIMLDRIREFFESGWKYYSQENGEKNRSKKFEISKEIE